MKSTQKVKILVAMAALAFVPQALGQDAASTDWQAVDEALGVTGEMNEGNVYKFSLPRSDLELTSDDVVIDPGFALGSWVAFKPMGNSKTAEVIMMGDLVLTEDELNGVLSRLQEGGIGQTAIHKHLPDESPAVWWTHIDGHGDPVALAETVRAALEETGTPLEAQEGGEPQALDFDTEQLDQIMRHKGEASGLVYKFSVPRAETITAHGEEIPPSMGTANALNFQSLGDGQAAINGDFVMTTDEVNGVIEALREHGIQVVTVHNHMMTEKPRLFFMHFWQEGEATELARGLRAALDQVNTADSE